MNIGIRKWCFIILVGGFSCSLLLGGTGDTPGAPGEGKSHFGITQLVKYIVAGIGGLLVIIVVIVRSLPKRQPPQNLSPENHDRSYFKEPLNDTILEYLQSKDYEKVCLALQHIVNSVVVTDAVMVELTKLIGGYAPYEEVEWLDLNEKCRIVRFLHLSLEKNRARQLNSGFGSLADFHAIYWATDHDYCCIRGKQEHFIPNLWKEIRGIVSR